MDMMTFLASFTLARKKGLSSRDAMRSGLLGATVGGANPGVGLVVSDRVARRYEPKPLVAAPAAAPAAVADDADGQAGPEWARALIDEVGKNTAKLKRIDQAITDLGERVTILEGFHKDELNKAEEEGKKTGGARRLEKGGPAG